MDRGAAKDRIVEQIKLGVSIKAAVEKIGYSYKSYEAWRREDADFKRRVDAARQLRGKREDVERGERLGFAEWREKYLGVSTPWHQMQWVDLLEGREPRDLHPSQQYEPGKRNRLLVNCPPFHPVVLDTPILTGRGWRTIGEVQAGDTVFDSCGRPTRVYETWESPGVEPVFEVEFATGDTITCDARHLWHVQDIRNNEFEKTTAELMGDLRYSNGAAKWRVQVSGVATGLGEMGERPEPLPLDPYVLGYWLGDGATGKPEIAVGVEDCEGLLAQLKLAGLDYSVRTQRGGYSVYVKGIRGILRSLGVLDHKHIPDSYAIAPAEDRTALLQGLMDSDGTVTTKDGRCSFAQNEVLRPDLVRDVYRLVASLGFLPRKRDETRSTINPSTGLPFTNHQTRIYFKPNTPVFRLERKLAKQRVTAKPRQQSRRIVDIRPAGSAKVKCLSVLAPGSRYQLGDGCIETRNGKSVCITIDYVTYRLCMDPGFRVILISAGQDLAKDFLFGVKQRLTAPDFLELQKTYAPDGGWEATAESWTESKIVFGTEVRAQSKKAFHEKDANVLAIGMRSKVYGRRADLIIVDDGVDSINVAEHSKQMKWLRGMVESRIEAGGKLLVVGTRVSAVDLYSELMKPENYANQRVPWTYLASPAILEEGKTPEEHVTLWPYADVPWVQPDDAELDECLCENTVECSTGIEVDGQRKYARWDGLHLENGPRASNNNTDWALIFQQRSVAEDATFPEHAVSRAVNGARQAGPLKAATVGHPPTGMHGKYVIGGLDPAVKGFAGMVVVAVDRETEKRYVLTAWNLKAPTSQQLKEKMRELTLEYDIDEWRVEKTGLLQFFTQDAELRSWMASRGVRFTEHYTGTNKWDSTYGISSLAPLFGEYDKAWDDPNGSWREITPPLIELPRAQNSDGLKALTHQLITWTPELDPNKVPCDMVMALWFALVGAREHLGHGRGNVTSLFGRSNRFISPRSTARTSKVNLADYRT